MKIKLASKIRVEDRALRDDLGKIETTINRQQEILDLDSRTSDPTGFETTDAKIRMWYRSDLQQIRFIDNGTTYKLQASAV